MAQFAAKCPRRAVECFAANDHTALTPCCRRCGSYYLRQWQWNSRGDHTAHFRAVFYDQARGRRYRVGTVYLQADPGSLRRDYPLRKRPQPGYLLSDFVAQREPKSGLASIRELDFGTTS